jgi:tetratricopeptide (TPR) repeat protein
MARCQGKSRIAVILAVFALAVAIPVLGVLLGADEVLRRLQMGVASPQVPPPPDAAQLLVDIQRFRGEADTLDAAKAAADWLALYDRAAALGHLRIEGDVNLFDLETTNVVGLQSVLAALPGPASWPALREGAGARAKQAPEDARPLALRLVAELLTGEPGAAAKSLDEYEGLLAKAPPKEGDALRAQAAYFRAEMARLHGSAEEIAESFAASLDAAATREFGEVAVPDLAGLVGEARAAAILRAALLKRARLHVAEGDRTRTLARRIALEMVEDLPVPQWGLADGMEAAELYEALARRFEGVAAKVANLASPEQGYDPRKADADAYYFLHLVVRGRHADAEKALRTVAGRNALHLPRNASDALERAGYNEALYGFLHTLLGRHPEVRAWEVYTRQAAYTGHSAQALALVEAQLLRKDLPHHVLADLRVHRINALLAADRIEPALGALRELLAAPPKQDESTLEARTGAALRLAGLGRVLQRRELTESGLSFARAVLDLPADRERLWRRGQQLKELFAEQRKAGLPEQAQAMALAELERGAGAAEEYRQYGMAPPGERTALLELAGLHGAAQRHKDVIALLDESPKWAARDMRDLLAEKDSLGVPLGLTAARALEAGGNHAAALTLARALVDALPGYDPAYELLAGLDKEALAHLQAVYARDRFEERPLIWMAIVLHRQGRSLEAEALIRQAIVIDPSDGEEGPSDRMRAYAVLAEILDAKGAKAPAAAFRRAVQAIRISERSDELHKLGLYERAFAGYREALGHFSDAYCIQSRMAVRLYERGRREEAFEHYRRAYELMPDSFGRVESHCFGCESVFQGPAQQKIAEQVFTGFLKKEPQKPQLHYLLGYLEKERGLHAEALKRFRAAVNLDPEYLNAWKHLHELGGHVYVAPRERDVARLKLLELDPLQRHVRYDLRGVADLAALWRAVESANAVFKPGDEGKPLYPLRRSAAAEDEAQAKLPEPMRAQMKQVRAMMASGGYSPGLPTPRKALADHKLLKAGARLMGVKELGRDVE